MRQNQYAWILSKTKAQCCNVTMTCYFATLLFVVIEIKRKTFIQFAQVLGMGYLVKRYPGSVMYILDAESEGNVECI